MRPYLPNNGLYPDGTPIVEEDCMPTVVSFRVTGNPDWHFWKLLNFGMYMALPYTGSVPQHSAAKYMFLSRKDAHFNFTADWISRAHDMWLFICRRLKISKRLKHNTGASTKVAVSEDHTSVSETHFSVQSITNPDPCLCNERNSSHPDGIYIL